MWGYLFALLAILPLHGELIPIPVKKFIKEDEYLSLKSENNVITFEWLKKTKACFIDTGKLDKAWWLIFDNKATEVIIPKSYLLPKGVLSITSIPHEKYTILEFKLHDHFDIFFSKDDFYWSLKVKEKVTEGRFASNSQIKEEALVKKSLFLEQENWPNLTLTKAFYKDIITLNLNGFLTSCVLSENPDQGLQTPHETPYYRMLESKLGTGIQHYSSLVSLIEKENRITVHVETPLKGIPLETKKKQEFQAQVGIFKNYDQSVLVKYLQKPPSKKDMDYLERAWVELMIGNERQTLVYIQLFEDKFPGSDHHPFIRALKASAHLMDHSFTNAKEFIKFLPQTAEIRLLQGVILAADGFPIAQIDNIRKILLIYKNYSQNLREELLVPILIALLDAGDYETVKTLIKNIAAPENEKFRAYFTYCNAIAKIRTHQDGEKEILELKEQYAQLGIQLQAYLKYYDLSKEKITDLEKAKALVNLSYMWRGDQFEFMVLYKAVQLYAKNKKYSEALFLLKRIRDHFPDTYHILHLEKDIIDYFSSFFKQDLSLKSPLKVISLYKEFRNYSQGSDMIRIVANLMIDQDLLDQAAELLSKASMCEKDPAALNDLYLKVARIHIDNKNGEAALSILEKAPKPSPLLKARSYATMGRLPVALTLLEKENTIESLKLGADLLILEKEWSKAQKILFTLLLKLDDVKHKDIKLETLTLLAMINIFTDNAYENQALSLVHEKFFAKLSKEKREFFYALITNPEMFVIDRPSVEEQLKNIENLESLIKKYH